MGQHKYNKTAQLAAEGKIPPKQKKMGKAEIDKYCETLVEENMRKRCPDAFDLMSYLDSTPYNNIKG